MRRWARRIGIGIGVTALILLVAITAGIGFIRTSPGETWLAGTITRMASSPDQTVTVTDITGALPFDLHIRRIALGDRGGTWLTIDDARVVLAPAALLHGLARIDVISAARIDMMRSPGPSAAAKSSSTPFSLPNLPVGIELDRFAIDRIDVAAAAAGQEVSLGVTGSARLAAGAGHVTLDVRRLDGAGNLTLDSAYGRLDGAAGEILDLRLHGEEPSGVLLAALLPGHQKLPLRTDLAGNGPLDGWRGRLDASAGGEAAIGADLSIARLAGAFRLAVGGTARVAALLPEALQAPVGDSVGFDTAITFADTGAVGIDRLKVTAGGGTLDATGNYVAKTGALDGKARVVVDLTPFASLAGGATSGKLTLDAALSGGVARPSATLILAGTDLAASGATMRQAALTVQVRPATDGMIGVSGSGAIDGLTASGLPPAAGLGDRIELAFDLAAARSLQRIEMTTLSLTGAGLDLAAEGAFDQGRITGHAHVAAADLARFNALTGMALGGGVELTADASSPDGRAIDASLSGSYRSLRVGVPAAAALLGADGTLALSAARAGDGLVSLKDVKLAGADLTASGGGSYDPAAAEAKGELILSVPDLQPLGKALGTPMAGRLTLTGTGAGSRADLRLDGSAIAAGAARIDRLEADLAVPDLRGKAATLTASVSRADIAATLKANIAEQRADHVTLTGLHLSGPETVVDGNIDLDTRGRVATGKVVANAADLAAWAPMIGPGLAGRLTAALDLTAGPRQTQAAGIVVTASGLATGAGHDAVHVKSARLDAHLTDLLGKPGGRAEAEIAGVSASGIVIQSLSLAGASERAGIFDVSLDARGTAQAKPLNLTTKGSIAIAGSGQKLTLTALDGQYGDLTARLLRSLSAEHDGARMRVSDLDLAIAGGRVSGEAATDGRTVSAALKMTSLSVGTLAKAAGRSDAMGTASLTLHLAGPTAAPTGAAEIAIRDLGFAAGAGEASVPINLTATATLMPESMTFKGHLSGIKGEAALDLSGTVPVAFAANGAVSIPAAAPLQARLQGGGRLEPLNDVLPIGEDHMAGKYAIDLAVTGSVSNPQAGGTLTVSDGSYTNDASGMTLRDLAVGLVGEGRQFTLARLSASDGGDGRLTASGKLDLGEAGGPRFDLRATLKSFTGARTDEVTAVLSGTAAVTGSLAAPAVTSDLTIDRADVNIPRQLPASYPALDVIRVNSLHPPPPRTKGPPPPAPFAATLAVSIHDAGQTFVRGDGLDSEWKGDLSVSGTSAAPRVTGELQSITGTMSVLGTDFTLQRGVVDFVGSTTPVFDIQAQAQTADVTALVELQGTPDQPKLTLSSTPVLPQDEVLSHIMFGSGTSQLTPVEGLQIAAAAASLADGGGPGVLDRLRGFTGLDRLSLGQGGTTGASAQQGASVSSGTSISGGKYVAPGVYVGVAQGISSSTTRATVKVNITPHVTLNATAGAGDNSGSSVGAEYQLDY